MPYLVENLNPLYFKDGNIIWFQNNHKIDGKFFYYSFFCSEIQSFIEACAGTGTVGTYTIDSGKKTPIFLPNINERRELGAFFSRIDNLITLHQRKDLSIFVKKLWLIKPKTTHTWEQCRFEKLILDIADGPFGSNLKTEHYTTEKEARIVQLSNLSDYGWVEENTKYTTVNHANEIKRCIIKKDNLIIGKMMPAGMTIICPRKEKMYVLSSDCVRVELNQKDIINEFFLYVTKSEYFLSQVNNDSQGSTRIRTSITKIKKMLLNIPKKEEQIKIGKQFHNIDNLITLHQHYKVLYGVMLWKKIIKRMNCFVIISNAGLGCIKKELSDP